MYMGVVRKKDFFGVKWDKECRQIEEGSLWIRNLRNFNIALLGKWRWKVNVEKRGICYDALANTYDNVLLNLNTNGVSRWWKDIFQLEIGDDDITKEYLVKETYKTLSLNDQSPSNHPWTKVWNKVIPLKMSCMVWKLL